MATYTYKGTKIYGTSTTPKIFKKSGIEDAREDQTYFNTSSGHVYTCDTAGDASTAKWRYTRTDIVAVPSVGVAGLGAPTRTSGTGNQRYMKAKWKIPGKLVDEKRGDRAQGLYITWKLGIVGKDPKKVIQTGNENKKESSININNFVVGDTTYTRESFYPFTSKKLSYVYVNIQPYNAKGKGAVIAEATREFKKPRKPSISAISFNTQTGDVSVTITTNPGSDYYERYDTRYVMTIKNTRTKKTWKQYDSSSYATSINLSYDASDYQNLGYGNYIQITIQAWSRGFAGNSESVTRTYYVAYPAQTTISGVDVSSRSSSGKCTVRLKTNHTVEHPVDRVRLEYLPNVTYKSAETIPGDASWVSTDIQDDASCSALAMAVTDLIPDAGKYTWIRVKSYHANEAVLYRYSAYKRVTALETKEATAADDKIEILSATAGENGTSIVVILGWNASGTDDATGTELTWSEDQDTWASTEAPEMYTFEWSDGNRTVGNVTYHGSATITIKGLEEGKTYYIRARRYLEGDRVTYSAYAEKTCATAQEPEAVVASCDEYVANGSSFPVFWTFSGNSLQTEWRIVVMKYSGGQWKEGTVLANGKGSAGATQIDTARILAFATNNSLDFTVQVSTGSGFVVSERHTVTIIDPPTLTLTIDGELTAQPFSFQAAASSECDLIVTVTSHGAHGQFPTGMQRQPAGDTVYSGIFTPVWTEGEDIYTTTVALPGGLDFWDLGEYDVEVMAVDRSTGLYSEEQTEVFTVNWAHQAPDPVSAVTITPSDIIDENGVHHQKVTLSLIPPENSDESDLYDIYRLTGDGAYLIGESFPLTCTVEDEYAPFGDGMTLYYRVAIRTADGDVEFTDIEYAADGSAMRFDWADGTLELPYNIEIGDSYKKDIAIRHHMDGSVDGYWNRNIERKASLNSDLIRLEQQTDVALARKLARYPGAVFVRTPDGSAYEANVQVSDMSTTGVLESIAIDAIEIGLTDEFILPSPYELQEESGESGESGTSGS